MGLPSYTLYTDASAHALATAVLLGGSEPPEVTCSLVDRGCVERPASLDTLRAKTRNQIPPQHRSDRASMRHQTACSCLLLLIASFQKTDWNSRDTSVNLISAIGARSQIRSGGHPNAQVESSDNSGSISSGYNHTWSSNTVMPGFTNPFYSQGSTQIPPVSPSASAGPPSYDASTRPGRPTPPARPVLADQPVSYGSLSDLTKGRQGASSGFSYTPQPERQGYSSGFGGGSSGGGSGNRRDDAASRDDGSGGRRMPPPPSNYGKEAPTAPPRRTVAPGM